MNIQALTQLAEWLEDGAPHVVFSMEIGVDPVEYVLDEYEDDADLIKSIMIQRDEKGLGDCGTVCCIAGYAATKIGNIPVHELFCWAQTRNEALHILGLPDDGEHFGHNLFNHRLAPENCTPQQAAQAVRNVIAGKEAWA